MNPGVLTWQNFRSTVLAAGQERMHLANANPYVVMFADRGGGRIGLLVAAPPSAPQIDPLLLRRLDVEFIVHERRRCLCLSCSDPRFFREAYFLFSAVADSVIDGSAPIAAALAAELVAFQAILEEHSRLSLDRQVGLFGELTVLRRLIEANGAQMLTAWTGPLKEPHDFRLGRREFEVKTSRGTRRVHTINGLAQTVPSRGYHLEFLSVLIGQAGADGGESIPALADAIRTSVSAAGLEGEFDRRLQAAGYGRADAPLYPARWTLRAPIAAISVDDAFPAITQSTLSDGMGASFGRLREISYSVSLDGLGAEWHPSRP